VSERPIVFSLIGDTGESTPNKVARELAMKHPELDHFEGYLAMYAFLNLLWERRDESWDELAMMLGGMSLLADRVPADQGNAQDWDEALEAATGRRRGSFDPMDTYKAMLAFLRTYESRGAPEEFKRLIDRMAAAVEVQGTNTGSQIWQDWIMCVARAKANEVDAWLRLKK
jgi:hypothetical protein